MANPQIDEGFLRLANELVEKLGATNISGQEFRILMIVFRKTYCWHKKLDHIPLSQFVKMCDMKRVNVARSIKSLVVKRLLVKGNKGLGFNKNYEEWVVVKRLPPVVKPIVASSQTTLKTSSQLTTLKRKKDIIQKKLYSDSGKFNIFWDLYDKKIGDKNKLLGKWNNLSESDKDLIIAYVPRYKLATPDKKYRKNPETFLNNKSWLDEIIESDKEYSYNGVKLSKEEFESKEQWAKDHGRTIRFDSEKKTYYLL